MANKNLQAAKAAKKDEFYTQLTDIEKELRHYKEHFQGKTVLCNCDDPRVSNFYKYFSMKFEQLGLKRLICTCYKNQEVDLFSTHTCEQAVYIDYTGGDENILPLKGDGDFRSQECIELLKQADIVVTNPPFSLFREFIAQLVKYDKRFLVICNINAIKYKEIFRQVIANKMWMGYKTMGSDMLFETSAEEKEYLVANEKPGSKYRIVDGNILKRAACCWLTNLDNDKRHIELTLYRRYEEDKYPKYNNFDAIDVSKVDEIPEDYDGVMGVPISFLDFYNPDLYEIIGSSDDSEWLRNIGVKAMGYETIELMRSQGNKSHLTANMVQLYYIIEGKFVRPYARILIRRKQR